MANLKIDWFGRSLSHRADKTSNTYAKVNCITGKTFLVTLRNPYTSDRFKDANIAQNNKMGALWMGIAAWVKAAQATGAAAEDAAQLARFVKGLRSQHRPAHRRHHQGRPVQQDRAVRVQRTTPRRTTQRRDRLQRR